MKSTLSFKEWIWVGVICSLTVGLAVEVDDKLVHTQTAAAAYTNRPVINDTYRGVVKAVHDGDSIKVDLMFVDNVGLFNLPLRLEGVYAAELKTEKGLAAQKNLAAMIPAGTAVYVQVYTTAGGTTKTTFNRTIAHLWKASADGTDVNAAQVAWLKSHGAWGGTGL